AHIKLETIPPAAGVSNDQRQIILNRQQADGLIRARQATKKRHKHPLGPGVLVGDETQNVALFEHLHGGGSDAALGEADLPLFPESWRGGSPWRAGGVSCRIATAWTRPSGQCEDWHRWGKAPAASQRCGPRRIGRSG